MSYRKAMIHNKCKNRRKATGMHMGFSVLPEGARRRSPWIGSSYFPEEGDSPFQAWQKDQDRERFLAKWEEENQRLLKLNPAMVFY